MKRAIFFRIFFASVILCFLLGCDERYAPEELVNPNELLVVEGFIEMNDTTTFKLSKTIKLSDGALEKTVDDALVWVEDQNQNSYPLFPFGKGIYKSEKQNLNQALQYRIHITMGHGVKYISDFVEPVIAPPIDSIIWESQPDGVQLYLDTHDPLGNSRYYRWSYEETWQFSIPFPSLYIYDPLLPQYGYIRPRVLPEEEMPSRCFTSAGSSTIILGNSTALSEDIIYKFPIYKIDLNSNRLQWRYSIEVRQFALTKEAFQYWEGLKNISTNMGSLFDVQPYQLTGNIHKVNSDEMVIGFISAGSKSTERIFIDKMELPLYKLKTRFDDCEATIDEGYIDYSIPQYVPLGRYPDPKNPVNFVLKYTTLYCADCSKTGKVEPPDFWQ